VNLRKKHARDELGISQHVGNLSINIIPANCWLPVNDKDSRYSVEWNGILVGLSGLFCIRVWLVCFTACVLLDLTALFIIVVVTDPSLIFFYFFILVLVLDDDDDDGDDNLN